MLVHSNLLSAFVSHFNFMYVIVLFVNYVSVLCNLCYPKESLFRHIITFTIVFKYYMFVKMNDFKVPNDFTCSTLLILHVEHFFPELL